jgi:hypothetical protein
VSVPGRRSRAEAGFDARNAERQNGQTVLVFCFSQETNMPRKNGRPTDDELRAVLEAMRARGAKTTVDAFIEAAGGGDRTFMTEFLSKWREEVASREGAAVTDLPPAMKAVVGALELGVREVLGQELARQNEHFRIVDRELRAREAESAAAAAKAIDDLKAEQIAHLGQISNLTVALEEERQRVGESLAQIELMKSEMEVARLAAAREREALVTVLDRLERDVANTRDRLSGSEEARRAAERELDSLRTQVVTQDLEVRQVRDLLSEGDAREIALHSLYESSVAAQKECEQKLESIRIERDEERAARADIARQLRLCTEGITDSLEN